MIFAAFSSSFGWFQDFVFALVGGAIKRDQLSQLVSASYEISQSLLIIRIINRFLYLCELLRTAASRPSCFQFVLFCLKFLNLVNNLM